MKQNGYYINENGEFVIERYNRQKPFSSFLPAVAGLYGKPLWAYYVNRGQCMATFGVNNKDYSILEFQPANKAYRQTPLQGFRTFLKLRRPDGSALVYEPFRDTPDDSGIENRMRITSYDLTIEEVNRELGLKVEVMYCTLPGETLAGLIRRVTVTNLSGAPVEAEVLDGMPAILPYYLTNEDMKEMSNLRQAWMHADLQDGLPFYRIKALPYDTPETVLLEGGNFYLNFDFAGGARRVSQTVVDPTLVFGTATDFSYPQAFLEDSFAIPAKQVDQGFTPCGFGYKRLSLAPGEADTTYTLIGSASNWESYHAFVNSRIRPGYIEGKIAENRDVIERSKRHVFTASSQKTFDLYCGQTFLDNYLRGGYPIRVGNGKHTLYVYSRKHGDLEREYNFFQVDATNYSQGNSNFRDVNQNRRNDVYFFPYLGDASIHTFFDLLQLDGFNPLVLCGSRFEAKDEAACGRVLSRYLDAAAAAEVSAYIQKAFTPGALLGFLEAREIAVKDNALDAFLNDLLEQCEKEDVANFQEGYWVDHWTYNADLLEQFAAVFPDKLRSALFETADYTYYDNDEVVVPRTSRYVLTENGVRQYGAVQKVPEKTALLKARDARPNQVRTLYGKGEVYRCTLASKILVLLTNKIASLDPEGVGLEMEGNKPGWCDALNGLPGILGSSINESAEVGRLARMLLEALEQAGDVTIRLPEEAKSFFDAVSSLLSADLSPMAYWEQSNDAKEAYRAAVTFGILGQEQPVSKEAAMAFLRGVIRKVDQGIDKAYNPETGVYDTYFINEAVTYDPMTDEKGEPVLNASGLPLVRVTEFKQRPIPPFLEGQVHVMRTRPELSAGLHEAVKKSGMYDEKLDMFKVNANIMDETKEIGRQNVFPRGWLENEAVFLHMEYKYFLELLRSGLYDEFAHYLRTSFVPSLDPAVYGRSTLENSSFIASSAHPDARIHGTGYVSRLTGASTEFLTMWRFMTVGQRPFLLDDSGALTLRLDPKLPGFLFTEKTETVERYTESGTQALSLPAGSFACDLLGSTLLVYHNDSRVDTYAKNARIGKVELSQGETLLYTAQDGTIPAPYAQQVRDGQIDRIDAYIYA